MHSSVPKKLLMVGLFVILTCMNISSIIGDDLNNPLNKETNIFEFVQNRYGDWIWIESAGGTSDESGNNIAVDNYGNCLIIGDFEDSTLISNITLVSQGLQDVFVAKLDNNGSWLWAVSAGGINNDNVYGCVSDNDGCYYITGTFKDSAVFGNITLSSQDHDSWDIFVAKLDGNGSWQWAVSAGGNDSDTGKAITIDMNYNCYITGVFEDSVVFGNITVTSQDQDSWDVFVAKIDTNGAWQWAVHAGGMDSDYGFDIAIDTNQNCYITGYFTTSALFGNTTLVSQGSVDFFVAKLDSNGCWQWAKAAGGADGDFGHGITVDTNQNCYITGMFTDSALFGNITLISQDIADIFVTKLDINGSWQWAKAAGGINDDRGLDVAVDGDGDCYVTGSFAEEVMFDNITLLSQNEGSHDIFISKIDTNGTWKSAIDAGSNNTDIGMGIAVDSDAHCYITGCFTESALFGNTTLISQGGFDVFIAKLFLLDFQIMPITTVSTGWNFVSSPYNSTQDSHEFIIKHGDYYYNWTMATTDINPTSSPMINQFMFGWNRTYQYYYFETNLEPGFGCWIYSYQICEIWNQYDFIPVDYYITSLESGWNIISVPYIENVSKIELLVNDTSWSDAVTTGLVSDFIFCWNQAGQFYNFGDMLMPGYAYWIYAYQSCKLKRAI